MIKGRSFATIVDGRSATVVSISDSIATVEFTDSACSEPETAMCKWSECGLNDDQVDRLMLPNHLVQLLINHQRHLQHQYLDRNQTYGEIQIKNDMPVVAFLDYMMKLRSKSWCESTGDFHSHMMIGTSMHVLCVRRRIEHEDELDAAQLEAGFEVGDYRVSHFDTFCSNTTQGGYPYETAACLEGSLSTIHGMEPAIVAIDCACSDAGSGYKSTAEILFALRESKKLTNVQVKRWHFNGGGEGKRNETDCHNPVIKKQRDAALRAKRNRRSAPRRGRSYRQPTYEGGVNATTSRVLTFGYDGKVTVKAIDGIQSLHDFERMEGGIKVWKSYKVGPGKFLPDTKLDKLYPGEQREQGSTGARCWQFGDRAAADLITAAREADAVIGAAEAEAGGATGSPLAHPTKQCNISCQLPPTCRSKTGH